MSTKQTYVIHMFYFYYGRLMIYALVSGSSNTGSSPGTGDILEQDTWVPSNLMLGDNPAMD